MTVAPKTFARKYIWFIMTLCLLPWFVVQSQLSINGDTAWLLTAARRLLDGGMMSTDFYETNPPLSVLYHIPPVFLAKILAVPEYILVFLYFSGLIALSACAVNAVLKSWDFLETEQRYMIVAAFLVGNTILTAIALGEREHIIFLGLMPFLLAQLSLTWKHPLSRKLLWVLMIFGTFAVLLKPHYGLLPTLLLVHRMIVQKRF
ncbi:MAG: hypothetical protein CO093_02710 [Alphaproteobacteria bacterium CG_4_9_14_3_um_filter_47_13]|nr:MAG: hypothetical protein CO093_02710 [Alphaproteobacteria bacterium CG_4_9_14_3_um_filter_47_13]